MPIKMLVLLLLVGACEIVFGFRLHVAKRSDSASVWYAFTANAQSIAFTYSAQSGKEDRHRHRWQADKRCVASPRPAPAASASAPLSTAVVAVAFMAA